MKIKTLVYNLIVALLILGHALITRQTTPVHTANAKETFEDQKRLPEIAKRDTSCCMIALPVSENK